jgi:hypothetical protein
MTRSGSAYRLIGVALLLAMVGGGTLCAVPLQSLPASGPLRKLSSNGRYFSDGSGKAVYLTGSHSWDTFQRWLTTSNPAQYFDLLQANNHNFMRFWVADTAWSPITNAPVEPQPYVRTGPGTAADGGLKFNLNQLNQNYFNQLRSTVIAARDRGIYVSVMLFNSWGIGRYGPPHDTWPYHPFRSVNNVNGINGDPNGDNVGYEYHTNQIPSIVALQQTYVKKVIDTVNDLDNVLYEICNEDDVTASRDWQYDLITFVRNYEASKSKQHPVGMTEISNLGPAINSWLTDSSADWISPGAQNWDSVSDPYNVNPPDADSAKVSLLDTDHLFYNNFKNDAGLVRAWVWKSFARGHNPLLMEDLESAAGWIAGRSAMGQTRSYANRINLASMTPQDGLSSTGYCLANAGSEYIAYQPGSAAFSVFLSAGTYSVEWFNTVNGTTSTSSNVTVSTGWRSFTPPFAEAALYLKATAISGGTNGASFISQTVPTSMTAGAAASVSVTMQNTGTSTWTAATNHLLGAQNPHDNTTWGSARVTLAPGESIAPGQTKTFSWTITAPSTAGTYNFQWRMVQELVEWFGATTPNVAVSVTSGGGGSGLVGSWSLNEGSGTFAADASGNGNHGMLVNGAGWTAGQQGAGASLDGINDYITIPSSSSLNSPQSGLTVALWVNKRAMTPSYAALAGRRFGPGWDDVWVLYYNNSASDEYSFGVRTSSPVYVTGPSSTGDLNTWVHLAGVYDGSRIRIYRNGVEVASAPQSGTIPFESSPLVIGAGDNGSYGIEEFTNAGIDEVRLYNRALSASEIQTLAGSGGGGTTVYVSDLSWTYAVSGWGPIEKDRSNGEDSAGDGSTMRINGVSYSKGLGCHAYSEIRYALGGQYTTFLSDVGVDDEIDGDPNRSSSIVFQVWADGVKLYDSGTMTWSMAAKPVNVNVAGKQELRLIVTDAGDNIWYDHADWAGARLTR